MPGLLQFGAALEAFEEHGYSPREAPENRCSNMKAAMKLTAAKRPLNPKP